MWPTASMVSMARPRIFLSQRMALRITDQHLRQRTDLHRRAIEARRLDPGVFLIAVPAGEVGIGYSLIGMERLVRRDSRRGPHLR
jgi:hypothetical protein